MRLKTGPECKGGCDLARLHSRGNLYTVRPNATEILFSL
jgi:hypothetical protein